jgi:hypothetical protein
MQVDAHVVSLTGIYDADGSLLGEVRYWLGARVGAAHCSLCDITHGTFREKPQWREACAALDVPMQTIHRDEQSAAEHAASDGALPCILGTRADGTVSIVVTSAELDTLGGDPERLAALLAERLSIAARSS